MPCGRKRVLWIESGSESRHWGPGPLEGALVLGVSGMEGVVAASVQADGLAWESAFSAFLRTRVARRVLVSRYEDLAKTSLE